MMETAQMIFRFPGEVIVKFVAGLFGFHSVPYGWFVVLSACVAIIFWAHILKGIGALIKRWCGW